LFALPQHGAQGAELIWGTCDAIWTAIGDTSRDINWYSKRATLSAVYGATVLYWLGDDSDGNEATWAFLDRRIENVMQFEKAKAQFNKSPIGKLMAAPLDMLGRIRAPKMPDDMPGAGQHRAAKARYPAFFVRIYLGVGTACCPTGQCPSLTVSALGVVTSSDESPCSQPQPRCYTLGNSDRPRIN
jgi:hypothetical protein